MSMIWAAIIIEALALLLFFVAAASNNHGHIGIHPYWVSSIFFILLVMNIAVYLYLSGVRISKPQLALSIANNSFGIIVPILLVNLGILRAKKDWIASGMEPIPDWSMQFFIVLCVCYLIVATLIISWFARK